MRVIVPPQPSLGPTTSQAVAVHGADNWHGHGYTGVGVKVGVIDLGFGGILSSQRSGELPDNIIARCYDDLGRYGNELSTCNASDEHHGTPVAESLMDIAPDAQLYIADPSTEGDLAGTVRWMIGQGVHVINHSVSWTWDGPGDGTSRFSVSPLNTLSLAVENGIVWVNSAGNQNQKTWYGQFNDRDGDRVHEFARGDEVNNFRGESEPDEEGKLEPTTFQLRSEYPARLCLFAGAGATGTVTRCSGFTSSSFPSVRIEWITEPDGAYGLVVQKASGAQSGWIQLQKWGPSRLDLRTARSITSPAESLSSGMLAVGAAHWSTPSEIEPSSSRGPLPIDRGYAKPTIVGADGARTSTWPRFSGTSQVAPHVAGLVALVRQRYPTRSPSQYVDYLEQEAEVREGRTNHTWGRGFAKLPPVGPDLVVSEVSVDDNTLDLGRGTVLRYTLRNQGNRHPVGVFRVTAYFSLDATISPGSDIPLSTNRPLSTLSTPF